MDSPQMMADPLVGPAMPDPMMDDPLGMGMEDQLSGLMDYEPEEELALGPILPEDYKPASRPSKKDTLRVAENLKALHALRLAQDKEWQEVLEAKRPGFFADDEEDIANDLVETMPLSGLADNEAFLAGYLAMHEPYPRLLNRDALDRDEAMAIEDCVLYDLQCEDRQYGNTVGGSMRLDEAQYLLRGTLVGLDVLDPDDPLTGLDMSLIDPATVFPVFGGRGGVAEVYRVYEDYPDAITAAYGGIPGGREYQRVERAVAKIAGKDGYGNTNRDERITVTEVWNRDWFSVVLGDSKELVTRKHRYARVPFTVVRGGFGAPLGSTSSGIKDDAYTLDTDWGEVLINDAALDIARKGQPYGWSRLRYHRIAEAVAGRQLTAFRDSRNPHQIRTFDPLAEDPVNESPNMRPGERTWVPIPGTIDFVPSAVDPNTYAALQVSLQNNAAGGPMQLLRMGAVPPQTSDSALGTMLEMGGAAETRLVGLLALFKRMRAEWRLQLREEWGDAMGRNDGVMPVPAQKRGGYGKTPFHRVTPAMLRRTGHDLEMTLHFWRPNVAVAQYLSTTLSAGLIAKETARRKLKAVPDPDRERDRIEDEQMHELPEVLFPDTMARIDALIEQAEEEGDEDSAQALMVARVALDHKYEQMVIAGAAPPGAGPAGAGGGGPQGPTPPAPPMPPRPQLPGTSLPPQGIGVGNQGGAPTTPTPPTPPMLPTRVGGTQ